MAKGIIYVMTTVVPGLIKIGKTGLDNFEQRMYNLEHNGYSNVTGLKRYFAIEVEDYDEKETLIGEIFSKSRLEKTELFALDLGMVVKLLSSFDGKEVYPKNKTKEQVFEEISTDEKEEPPTKEIQPGNESVVPDGTYYFNRKVKAWGNKEVLATMKVKDGKYIILKGSTVCPVYSKSHNKWSQTMRDNVKIQDDMLMENVEAASPSAAAVFVLGGAANGWTEWTTKDGKPIDIFRQKGGK